MKRRFHRLSLRLTLMGLVLQNTMDELTILKGQKEEIDQELATYLGQLKILESSIQLKL